MKLRKWICLVLALLLLATLLPQPKVQADTAQTAILTFSSNTVTETVHGAGYSVSGTTLTITAPGTYRVTGQCSEGSIVVAKSLSGVTLILDNLELSSAVTAPIVVKKQSSVALELEGESVLTDNEDSSTEDTNADFEGACIKVKSGSSLTISGDGTLRAFGNAKNGLKGAAESALTVNGGNLIVQAANNAVAFDGSVEVITGKVDLTADGDGLKSEPDETDTVSPGTVTIHGGEVRIRAPYTDFVAMTRREYKEVEIQMIDSRPLSDKQRRSCYAMIREIALWSGDTTESIKEALKLDFWTAEMLEMADTLFSLSNAPMSIVAAFQTWLARFIVRNDVPTKKPMLEYVDDIDDYVYTSLIHKKCVICGKKADLHHCEAVGMGRNRDEIDHLGMEVLPLCREHHGEYHQTGREAFFKRYHLNRGVEVDKTIAKIYKLNIISRRAK